MDTINDYLDQGTQLLGKLNGLPGYMLVLLSCFAVGFIIKRWAKRIPNESIPTVVALWGAVFNSVIADPCADTVPFRIWLVKNALVGFIIGVIAFSSHRYVWKPLLRKLAKRFAIELDDDSNPAAFSKPQPKEKE